MNSCTVEEMEMDPPTCPEITISELPELGKFGLNIIGASVLDVNIPSSATLSLTTELIESCQKVEVEFSRSSGRLDDLPWDFEIASNENWFWDLNQSTGVQTWTAQDENSEMKFTGFLPGSYLIEVFFNFSETPSQSKMINADYENYDVITDLSNPYGILLDGNDLYVANETEILKYDASNLTLEPEIIQNGLTNVTTLTKSGDFLVFAELFEGIDGNLSKLDLSQDGASREVIISGMSHAFGLASRGSNIYFSDLRQADLQTFDLSAENIEVSPLGLSGLGAPLGIAIEGDNLLVADESTGTLLFNFEDLTSFTKLPKVSSQAFANQAYLKDDIAYYNQNGMIVKVDINDPVLEVVNELSSLTRIQGIVLVDGKEIISERPLGRIIQLNEE